MSDDDQARKEWMAKRMSEIMTSKEAGNSPNKPVTMDDATYDRQVSETENLVVDCWAAWCGPCKAIAPIIEDLAADYQGQVIFGKLNVDENPSTAQRLSIMGIPTLLFYRDGQLVDRIIGAAPRDRIIQTMQRAFRLT